MAGAPPSRRLVTILAADVAGYTRLVEQDTDGTVAAWKAARDEVINPFVAGQSGRIIKFTGDGFLVEFPSVHDAVTCAIALQKQLNDCPLKFRMGLNFGDITDDGGDVHGEGVNIAARIEALAEPGGINISGDVYRQVCNRIEADYRDLGLKDVKNVSTPVHVYAVNPSTTTAPVTGDVNEGRKPAIAVLPFNNLSGDSEQDYFADGMVEEIITGLARIRWLTVIARNSMFAYKGKSPDLRKVGQELAVRYVVEGSVRKAGGRVRITAQLIDAESGGHLWADRFDGALDDVFELQDRITAGVIAAIEPSVRQAEIERAKRKRPDNLDAYDLYLRALEQSYLYTPAARTAGLLLLDEAIALDPGFVEAHGVAAFCLQQRYLWGGRAAADRESALRHAEAVAGARTDDSTALSFAALVFSALGARHDDALVMVNRALEQNPSSAVAHNVSAIINMALARPAQSEWHAERSLRLSPFDPLRHIPESARAAAKLAAGDAQSALACVRKGLEANPAFTPGLTTLVLCLVRLGRMDEARAAAKRLLEIAPDTRLATLQERYLFANGLGIDQILVDLRAAGLPE